MSIFSLIKQCILGKWPESKIYNWKIKLEGTQKAGEMKIGGTRIWRMSWPWWCRRRWGSLASAPPPACCSSPQRRRLCSQRNPLPPPFCPTKRTPLCPPLRSQSQMEVEVWKQEWQCFEDAGSWRRRGEAMMGRNSTSCWEEDHAEKKQACHEHDGYLLFNKY